MVSSSTESREQYDQLWKKQWANLHMGGPLARTRYRLAIQLLRLSARSEGRLLDVGAGNGAFMSLALRAAPRVQVHGAEFSRAAIDLAPPVARERLAPCDLQGDEPLPWGGNFNLMTCMEVLEHLHDDARALRHMADALVPGGRLLISVPAFQKHWGPQDVAAGHVRRYETEQLRGRILEAGFELERMVVWGGPLTWLYLRAADRIGPQKVMSIRPTGVAGLAASLLYQVIKLDDVLSFGWGEQWFALARKK